MEIIQNNYAENAELITVQCGNCNSILRCTVSELKNQCPCCGNPLSPQYDEKKSFCCDDCDYEFFAVPEGEGYCGLYYAFCPKCGQLIYSEEGIKITVKNLEMKHFDSSEDGVHIDFPTIKGWIKVGVSYLTRNPDECFYYCSTGDGFLFITRDDEEFYIMYTNNYKSTFITKE